MAWRVQSSCSICHVHGCINLNFGNEINCLQKSYRPYFFPHVLKMPMGLNGHQSTKTWTCRGVLIYLHLSLILESFAQLYDLYINYNEHGTRPVKSSAFRLFKIHMYNDGFVSVYRLIFNPRLTSQQRLILYIKFSFSLFLFFHIIFENNLLIYMYKEVEI